MRSASAFLLAPTLLLALLAGCGNSSDGKTRTAETTAKAGLPAVSGRYGTKPKIKSDPKVKPGKTTKSVVLVKGTGRKVKKGDLLVADYLGQIYKTNKVFDNSYDRGQPSGFQIGANRVIIGWDKTLVGVNAGSRVLMLVPPVEGYGEKGNTDAGIKGTDSLVFVVDVIASYGAGGQDEPPVAVTDLPKGLPTISGSPAQRPTVTVPKGTAPPKEAKAVVLAKGSGAPLVANKLTIVQFEAVSWAGKAVGSSWEAGAPQAVPLKAKNQPSPFDVLAGIPIGSRVLLMLPPQQQGGKPAVDSIAVVVDVIAQHGPAKEKSK